MKDIRLRNIGDIRLRNIGIGIGIFATIAFAAIAFATYQYIDLRNKNEQLESDLHQANNRITEQGETIRIGREDLSAKEAELRQKENQLQAKENQLQDQAKQLQAKEEQLRRERAEVARQQQIAAGLRANTETLGVCLQGVTLAIIATTPAEAAVALGAIEAECEEAAEIVENL